MGPRRYCATLCEPVILYLNKGSNMPFSFHHQNERWLALLGVFLSFSCQEEKSWATLEIGTTDAGIPTVQGHWVYESTEVDVDLRMSTSDSDAGCTTTGRLKIDEALATAERYYLEPTDCEVLELSTNGDIIFYESPTGHDWTTETLRVDKDAEKLELGPWSGEEPGSPTYRFELSAPVCPDDDDCECPRILRTEDQHRSMLELGRRCD